MDNDTVKTYKDPLTRIMDLMRASFGGTFKAYYEGDPIDIPKANFPCLIVEVQDGLTQLGATSTDIFQTRINIRPVFNKEDDYGAEENQDLTERKLRILVEGRDPSTGQYLPNSILGVLRSNFTLSSNLTESDIDWQYNIQPRANLVVTSEALVQVRAIEHVIVPNRN